jgi:ubiquinone/menaquinone biosynthesis C-methylase UbiE
MFHPDGPTFRELAIQALSSTERGYDLIAPKFDYTPFRTPTALLDIVAEAIGPPGCVERALDVCCGTGAAMQSLRARCRGEIVGIDMSQGMLDEAARRVADAPGDAVVTFVRGDALAMPFANEFDLATCFGAFGHIVPEDEPRLVRGIHRALREGGRFVFITSEAPPISSFAYWAARSFNAAMRVRNALLRPPFVMYYLTFLLPRARALLEAEGFTVEVARNVFPAPFERGVVVTATKR